ncbi:MAG: hypothetical protein COW08_05945 [Ignavibacteriales bacterium CG12_big_fil_rev_8_21_14_0_65_30_8]|nr:MAG: hypothetical protein COW08_05945 [Ignavibacteriales bacterium CG12_big_fil_rev_8_21_14_0_65_30_8]
MYYSLTQIENELKKRLPYPYIWGRKQNDSFDKQTNFIYSIQQFDTLLTEIKKNFEKYSNYDDIFNYALNRWYNFWSANAVEQIFCSFPNVKPAHNSKDRLIDFSIEGASFDHKTSVFPKKYNLPIDEAIKQTPELIKWFYKNQSQQQRKHLKNRLFIVLYSPDGEHWKLKAEISWLKKIIDHYMIGFNPNYLMKFSLEKNKTIISDIIWAVKK